MALIMTTTPRLINHKLLLLQRASCSNIINNRFCAKKQQSTTDFVPNTQNNPHKLIFQQIFTSHIQSLRQIVYIRELRAKKLSDQLQSQQSIKGFMPRKSPNQSSFHTVTHFHHTQIQIRRKIVYIKELCAPISPI